MGSIIINNQTQSYSHGGLGTGQLWYLRETKKQNQIYSAKYCYNLKIYWCYSTINNNGKSEIWWKIILIWFPRIQKKTQTFNWFD